MLLFYKFYFVNVYTLKSYLTYQNSAQPYSFYPLYLSYLDVFAKPLFKKKVWEKNNWRNYIKKIIKEIVSVFIYKVLKMKHNPQKKLYGKKVKIITNQKGKILMWKIKIKCK